MENHFRDFTLFQKLTSIILKHLLANQAGILILQVILATCHHILSLRLPFVAVAVGALAPAKPHEANDAAGRRRSKGRSMLTCSRNRVFLVILPPEDEGESKAV